jgi:PKD repeat protein
MPKLSFARVLWLGALLMGAAGCTVHQDEAPPLTGPSEFALSVGVTATPDAISQDGGSQSAIVVTARGPNGEARQGVTFRLDVFAGGIPVDYGTLSTKTVVTGSNGQAGTIYTAPSALPAGANLDYCDGLPGGCVTITATPIGTNFVADATRQVLIHLIPQGTILPPSSTPVASFTFAPGTPAANAPVVFDGSGSTIAQGVIASYSWNFGDGSTGSGKTATHTYRTAGTYNATLTVTNDKGTAASTTKAISVGGGSAPTADFVFSPTPAVVKGQVFFDASNSKAGSGHHIVTYRWNWGDGDEPVSFSVPTQQHDFQLAGNYQVTLTVVDEAGQEGTISKTVQVGSGAPAVSFITAVTNAATHTIQADGNASTAVGSATIARYDWSWGDGNSDANAASIANHTYAAAGTYTVKLTVTDSLGRVGISTASVTVP